MPALLRVLIAGTIGLVAAVQVVRVAAVNAFAASNPAAAARVWPGHPAIQFSSGLVAIANAARAGQPVESQVLKQIYAASSDAPLAEEPFLVRGVQAQLSGDRRLAERAFLAAKWRDGRSLPARYFLAEHYFREGKAEEALLEIGALARLAPGGVRSLAPYVAAYARSPGNRSRVRALLHAEPMLEEATLAELSVNPQNADLVLWLAKADRLTAKSAWLPGLMTNLTNARAYGKAREVWGRAAKVRLDPAQLLFDGDFKNSEAPPPFNWTLTSSAVGLAERVAGGGLHVMYYGQQDGDLASQLLTLEPGTYRLTMLGPTPRPDMPLRWSLTCAATNGEIQGVPLAATAGAGWQFTVPSGCAGQRLALSGVAGDLPKQSDVTIRSLRLARVR